MTKAKTPTHRVPFRRRREYSTDYKKRLAMVKSGKVRMIIRKTNKDVKVQFVEFKSAGDNTIAVVDRRVLSKKYGWNSKRNSYTAYVAGMVCAKMALEKGVKEFIVDLGLQKASKGSILFAAVQGAVDAGLQTNYDVEMVPKDKINNVKEEYRQKFEEIKKSILKV
ncbi:MAG: 50S ribosomal protein L18 [Candidatus ainarchaeum sp.]|nr:50S ribosomal protein L18 [Candidatus ainarchaeum sp.]